MLDLVLSLCEPFISTLMSLFCIFPLLVSHGVALLVYPLFFILVFGHLSFFGVTIKLLLLIGLNKMIRFFLGSLVGVTMGMTIQ